MKCAILGFGTVGGGTAELLAEQAEQLARAAGQPVELGYILVRRDQPEGPFSKWMVKEFSVIENDPEVGVVAEVIGGVQAAYEYTLRALQAGKSVVTSNKELVAAHGAELLALAERQGVSYLFEGSVGGGIPLIAPLSQCLAANRVEEVCGILNGTTNYILTAMAESGADFAPALRRAQELGYAEADPTADVEGLDTGRKTAILAGLCLGRGLRPEGILTRGIAGLRREDLAMAQRLGFCIKLLGRARRTEAGCTASVEPHLVPEGHLLSRVTGVMNACLVRASAVGELVFYGPGAGRRQTGSAVVSDIVQAVRTAGAPRNPYLAPPEDGAVPEAPPQRWYLRAQRGSGLAARFGGGPAAEEGGLEALLTPPMSRAALSEAAAGLGEAEAFPLLEQ